MKHAQRLRLEPRPSRIACATSIAGCLAAMLLVVSIGMPVAATLGCIAAVIVTLASNLWRCSGRGVPAIVHVGIDRRIAVSDREGRSRTGAILDDSYVGAALTTIVWRADGDPWWRPARAMLFVPDSLRPDEFRRLRVVLRYGLAPDGAATSGIDAG